MDVRSLRALARTLRAGDLQARLGALRSGGTALDVARTGAAIRTGVLRELAERPATTRDVAARHAWQDLHLAEAFLQALAAAGLLEESSQGWRATRRGRRLAQDDVASAAYDAFSGYHSELYRQVEQQLAGGPGRTDIERDGVLVARLSRFLDAFVVAELDRVLAEQQPTRVLDLGCGAASHLVHLLHSVPDAHGVGVESDPGAAALAEQAVAEAGLDGRCRIVTDDMQEHLTSTGDRFDLVLAANLIYYVPLAERPAFLGDVAARMAPGGRLVLVTTALTDDAFSRHFDLLLRAQAGARELPDLSTLTQQLTAAGLRPEAPRRIAPGEPLTSIVARRV